MSDARPARVLWGITGSVASIRADRLLEGLRGLGEVKLIRTERSRHFCPPLPHDLWVGDDADEWDSWSELGNPVLHIELRRWADVFVLAPASANTLAKLAGGMCDNLLTSVARAWDFSRPMVLAPAMNTLMWEHPVTAGQLEILRGWGARIVEPVEKLLACNDVGMGALAPVEAIVEAVGAGLAAGPRDAEGPATVGSR